MQTAFLTSSTFIVALSYIYGSELHARALPSDARCVRPSHTGSASKLL